MNVYKKSQNVMVLEQCRISLLITKQATEPLPPFCEESFVNDNFTGAHTGLPNLKAQKATFELTVQVGHCQLTKLPNCHGLECASDKYLTENLHSEEILTRGYSVGRLWF